MPLPDPAPSHSVTTTGMIVEQPLGKSLCLECGFVQRNRFPFLGLGQYYQDDYASYYERPGTEPFHRKRYQSLLEWMSGYLGESFMFSRVLDVGCGQGWMMEAISERYPGVHVAGIEPNGHNASIARAKGYSVAETKLESASRDQRFDLVYSNNVLQHVNDAARFLADMRSCLDDHGVMIVTCPDGSRPSIDLIWTDHNYSFLPQNLVALGKELGFATVRVDSSADNPSLPPALLLLLTDNPAYREAEAPGYRPLSEEDVRGAHRDKSDYLSRFAELNEFLAQQISDASHVYNFGASYWTSVLAAYCPDYWEKVEACVIDKSDDVKQFMNRPIMELSEIGGVDGPVLVLGTAPLGHEQLEARLQPYARVVGWNSYFPH